MYVELNQTEKSSSELNEPKSLASNNINPELSVAQFPSHVPMPSVHFCPQFPALCVSVILLFTSIHLSSVHSDVANQLTICSCDLVNIKNSLFLSASIGSFQKGKVNSSFLVVEKALLTCP